MTTSDAAVTGRNFLRATLFSVGSAVVVGALVYFGLRPTALAQATKLEAVVLVVYVSLFVGLCIPFWPPTAPPITLEPSGGRNALLAVVAWIATLGVIVLAYFCLGFAFGNPQHIAAQITACATDAQHLQGAPTAVWIIAIARGCLVVPLFEETLFRGLLLSWLKRHFRTELAIFVMAALFTLEHGSLLVTPYTFIFAVVAAWVREKTGALFNPVLMHVLNNVFLLLVGLRIHGR